MNIVADIVIFAWPAIVFVCFACLAPRRAVIAAYIAGWLFLPNTKYPLLLVPDYSKVSATSLSVLLAILMMDRARLLSVRPRWIDLPMTLFCFVPFLSSVTNGLGHWDGMAGVMSRALMWGVPYLLGRAYFTNRSEMAELFVGIFAGGLAYIPFCWFEFRMSPVLASTVYGAAIRSSNASRFGGWRPRVFMQDGLMLAMWMVSASFIGIWLWKVGAVRKLAGLRMSLLVGTLTVTTFLCRSTGALILLLLGLGAMWFGQAISTKAALAILVVIPPAYLLTRASGTWDGRQVTEIASKLDEDRAQSFQFRIENEDILVAKAMQRPFFGWGGWGRSRVRDEWAKDISIPDGLWIQVLGANGFSGLVMLYTALLLPVALLVLRTPSEVTQSIVWPLAILIVLFSIDCLFNAMENPVFVLVLGALSGVKGVTALNSTQRVVLPVQTPSPPRYLWPACAKT